MGVKVIIKLYSGLVRNETRKNVLHSLAVEILITYNTNIFLIIKSSKTYCIINFSYFK